jgi:hypothetical protein
VSNEHPQPTEIDYTAAKKIIAPALNTLVGGLWKVIEASYAQIDRAIRALVKRGSRAARYVKTWTLSIYSRHLSASLTCPPALIGSKAPKTLVDILITGSRPSGVQSEF